MEKIILNIFKLRNFTFAMFIVIFCYSCNSVQICIETKRKIRISDVYVNQIPLTVKELKELITQDTTHYKVVVFYSPCCGPCIEYMKTDYKKAYHSCDTTVKFFFVLNDCGGLKYNEDFLSSSGVNPEKMYYIRDTSKSFYYKTSENRMINIVNYIFDPQPQINRNLGVPTTCIVSKDNRLRLIQTVKINENDTTVLYSPYNLSLLNDYDFSKIDFDKIETVVIKNDSVCSSKVCSY